MSEKKQWETKDNSGSAFRNRRKQKDTHPDFTGEMRHNGQLLWLNIWEKRTQNGDTWYSISVSPKEDRAPELEPAKTTAKAPDPMLDDSAPF